MPILLSSAIGDIVRAVALPVVDRQRQPYVPTVHSIDDVRHLLHSSKARRYPPYVLAVLMVYVRNCGGGKRAKSNLEVEMSVLESEFPEFAAEFRAVFKSRGLVRDPLLEMEVSRCMCRRHRGVPRRSGATPPPMYASEDPDPEATRVLVQHIARAAGVSTSLADAAQDAQEALAALAPVTPTPKEVRRRTWSAW